MNYDFYTSIEVGNLYNLPKNKDNRTELEKEYDSLTTIDKIAFRFC